MSKRIPEGQRAKHIVEKLPPSDLCHIQHSFCETLSYCSLLLLAAAPVGQRSLQGGVARRYLWASHCFWAELQKQEATAFNPGVETSSLPQWLWQGQVFWRPGKPPIQKPWDSDVTASCSLAARVRHEHCSWFYNPQESHQTIKARDQWVSMQHALAARIGLRPGQKKPNAKTHSKGKAEQAPLQLWAFYLHSLSKILNFSFTTDKHQPTQVSQVC